MNLVKVLGARVADEMRLTKALRYGSDDVVEVPQISPFGVDSVPINGLIAVYSETGDSGESVVIGYVCKNHVSEVGETRFYSTDEDGVEQTFIYLKKDGFICIGGDAKNMVRFQELKSGFDQMKGDFNDLVSAFNSHTHATAAVGPPVPPTPVPTVIPASVSTASIDDCKIDEIKTL